MVSKSRDARIVMAAALAFCSTCLLGSMISVSEGMWPETWPEELEQFRDQSTTLSFGIGSVYDSAYEIPFRSREEFEAAWPHILKLSTSGSRLILEKGPSTAYGESLPAGVRILNPPGGMDFDASQGLLRSPRAESSTAHLDIVPEDVDILGHEWVPSKIEVQSSRSRDILLICDGNIIDLNRIPLPGDIRIVDRRF